MFINCPFDDDHQTLFRATIFAIYDCGFSPRCALEVYDSGQVRIERIMSIVEQCRYGVHDISRTELDRSNALPRFNMPLELGLFLGAQRFGSGRQRRKSCLILDREPYRYQKFISDIAGQDIDAHNGSVDTLIRLVRNWLSAAREAKPLPGGAKIAGRYQQFCDDLPSIASDLHLAVGELSFSDYANVASRWLKANLLDEVDPLA